MKVVVVDDSIVFRSALSAAINSHQDLDVIKTFSEGKALVRYLKDKNNVDLVTLDIEMPILDGLATLKEIRTFNKDIKIIMVSSLTVKGAEKTLEALQYGANEFVGKVSSGSISESMELVKDELISKILAFFPKKSITPIIQKISDNKKMSTIEGMSGFCFKKKPDILCIGSSTGGPDALMKIFRDITVKPSFSILLVQHMPPIFTAKLAQVLNNICSAVTVKEAEHDEELLPGYCYIAPGDFHMEICKKSGRHFVSLQQEKKVCHVRPSVDVLFNSVSDNFLGNIMVLVLTGMGSDGANGAEKISKINPDVFIQDESSSIVWGMPGAVNKKNIGAQIINLENIPKLLNAAFLRRS